MSSRTQTGLPLPAFYDAADAARLYLERTHLVANTAAKYVNQHNIQPARRDNFKIAAFGIDCQNGFILPDATVPNGLAVPGAVEDTQRITEWIYRNLNVITGLHFSMDTHRVFQIFHPAFWTDANGNHPDPLTPISAEEVKNGTWTPISNPQACLEYCQKLEATGKYMLAIWPYHTLLGGASHALVGPLMEASIFHTVARKIQTHFETKGTHTNVEHYSIFSPEVKELRNQVVGEFNTRFFNMLLEYDRIYVFGQARTHCVMNSLIDMRTEILAKDATLASKVYIVTDAMSDVPAPPLDPLPDHLNFTEIANQEFETCRQAGFNFCTTTDPIVIN